MDSDINKVYRTVSGKNVRILRILGSGMQGIVYEAEYGTGGQHVALKIVYQDRLSNPGAFKEGVKKLAARPNPSLMFLWPTDIIENGKDVFGYTMPLVPKGFYQLSHAIVAENEAERFRSYRVKQACALHLCNAFACLHDKNLAFMDINDKGIYVDPVKGNILIGDCDNCRTDGSESEVQGMPGFMAPELVSGKVRGPSVYTDRYSVSACIFMLLTNMHPLEGKRYFDTFMMSEKEEREQYGTDPVFIMDPNDRRNAPHSVEQRGFEKFWNRLPDYLRRAFTEEFSRRKLLSEPGARRSEADWQNILLRFKSETQECNNAACKKCRNHVPVFSPEINKCVCGVPLARFSVRIDGVPKVNGQPYRIPAPAGLVLYRIHFGVCNTENELNKIAVVGTMPDGRPGLKNISQTELKLNCSGGVLRPGEALPIQDGMTITAKGFYYGVTFNKMT